MKKNFWKNKKILITGHTGFKGSWLSNILLFYGARVYGYALKPNYKDDLYNITHLKKQLEKEFIGDILDFKKFNNFLKTTNPEIVFHLAAQPFVRRSIKNPHETFKTNCMGTLNVLEGCRHLPNLKSLLIITTDKVYFNDKKIFFFNEKDRLGGSDPYSSSKAAAELISETYGLNYYNQKNKAFMATVRAGNVIGGGDWGEDRLIPDLIKNCLKNKFTSIRNPKSVRPWQHVFDVLFSYLLISQDLYKKDRRALGSWNIGPNNKTFYTVSQVIKKFQKFQLDIKYKDIKINKKNRLKESNFLRLNNHKFKNTFKFSNKINFNKMIELTSKWYSHYKLNRSTIKNFTLKQINEYFN